MQKICICKIKAVPLQQIYKNEPIQGGGNTIKTARKLWKQMLL